jgi:glutathione S-transferase
MRDVILHHYPNSPFSEKVRLIFGFKKVAWRSVIIPVIMPKSNLIALTGGYRRTPVMQIGADIYCDTALIADVLERIAPTRSLYPPQLSGLARTLAQWADTTLFWTAIPYAFQPQAVQHVLGGMAPEQMKAFAADRMAFRNNVPRMSPAEATGGMTEYLQRLESMLSGGNPYLLGDDPCIADFSVYHCIWFVQLAKPVAGILDLAPKLKEWAARMAAIGHHEHELMGAEQALAIARESDPAAITQEDFVDTHGVVLGDLVAIMPVDYGLDPVEGELVISTKNQFAVRRIDPLAGTVVVHFPRIGFQLKKI